MLVKAKNVFLLCFFVVIAISCRPNSRIDDLISVGICTPQEYVPIKDSAIIESFALVTCGDGNAVGTFDITPLDSLVVVPSGGIHLLYIRFQPEWPLPSNFPGAEDVNVAGVEIFAGSCPLEPLLVCLPERNQQGKAIESNRINTHLTRIDERTLRIQYTLPDTPRQVMVSLNFCTLWLPDHRYCASEEDLGGNVSVTMGYVFRYESVTHITPENQDPNAECDCKK